MCEDREEKSHGSDTFFRSVTPRMRKCLGAKISGPRTLVAAKVFSSSCSIAPIDKHRNSLMQRRVRIIRRFASERDTISLALRRKRSPIFPTRRFVPSSPFGRARSISESFATSRTRRKQVLAIFDKMLYTKLCTSCSEFYPIKHCFFFIQKDRIAKGSRRNVNLIRSLPCTPSPRDSVAGKSIDCSKFAIRDFRPRARRTRTSSAEMRREGGEG